MKHAGPETFSKIDSLLKDLRQRNVLNEKGTGVFYWKSGAFLHFHDDPSGIFADVKFDGSDYSRFRVNTRLAQRSLLKKIDRCLAIDE